MKLLQKYGLLVVIVPALLPPPAPFKIFVLLAGVAAIPVWQFAAAIFIARFIRYGGEGLLAVYYGDQAGAFLQAHAKEAGLWLAGIASGPGRRPGLPGRSEGVYNQSFTVRWVPKSPSSFRCGTSPRTSRSSTAS